MHNRQNSASASAPMDIDGDDKLTQEAESSQSDEKQPDSYSPAALPCIDGSTARQHIFPNASILQVTFKNAAQELGQGIMPDDIQQLGDDTLFISYYTTQLQLIMQWFKRPAGTTEYQESIEIKLADTPGHNAACRVLCHLPNTGIYVKQHNAITLYDMNGRLTKTLPTGFDEKESSTNSLPDIDITLIPHGATHYLACFKVDAYTAHSKQHHLTYSSYQKEYYCPTDKLPALIEYFYTNVWQLMKEPLHLRRNIEAKQVDHITKTLNAIAIDFAPPITKFLSEPIRQDSGSLFFNRNPAVLELAVFNPATKKIDLHTTSINTKFSSLRCCRWDANTIVLTGITQRTDTAIITLNFIDTRKLIEKASLPDNKRLEQCTTRTLNIDVKSQPFINQPFLIKSMRHKNQVVLAFESTDQTKPLLYIDPETRGCYLEILQHPPSSQSWANLQLTPNGQIVLYNPEGCYVFDPALHYRAIRRELAKTMEEEAKSVVPDLHPLVFAYLGRDMEVKSMGELMKSHGLLGRKRKEPSADEKEQPANVASTSPEEPAAKRQKR